MRRIARMDTNTTIQNAAAGANETARNVSPPVGRVRTHTRSNHGQSREAMAGVRLVRARVQSSLHEALEIFSLKRIHLGFAMITKT